MNEELSLSIQAKILPLLEGKEGLASEIADVENRIMGSRNFAGSDRKQQQQLQQIVSGYATMQGDVASDLAAMIHGTGGNVSKQDLREMFVTLNRLERENVKTEQSVVKNISQHSGLLDEALGGKLTEEAREGFEYYRNQIKKAKDELVEWRKEIDNAERSTAGLFQQLKSVGVFALGGLAVNEAMSLAKTNAQIGARYKTAFDLGSPLGMYSEYERAELFEETRRRSQYASTIGGVLGGIGGFMLGGGWGAAAGAYFGGQIGNEIADNFNIGSQAEKEAELKFLQQSLGKLSEFVSAGQSYDVIRAKLRGSGVTSGNLGLGYGLSGEAAMRLGFASMRGSFDEDLFTEQTTFARAMGIAREQIYGLNRSARMTGQDVGISGLHTAWQYAKSHYGEGVTSQRVIEVLHEIRRLNEEQLKLNAKADAKDVNKMLEIPEMIFGDTAYGGMTDKGGQTLGLLGTMMNPSSRAEEAFLFAAMGTDNIREFNEMMKGGIFQNGSLGKILEFTKERYSNNPTSQYWILDTLLKGEPQGFVSGLTDLMQDDEKFNDFITRYNSGSKSESDVRELMEDYKIRAKENTSRTEMMNENLEKRMQGSADVFREMIYSMKKDWVDEWADVAKNAESRKTIIKKFNDVASDAIDRLRVKMGETVGIYSTDAAKAIRDDRISRAGDNYLIANTLHSILEQIIGVSMGRPEKNYVDKIVDVNKDYDDAVSKLANAADSLSGFARSLENMIDHKLIEMYQNSTN